MTPAERKALKAKAHKLDPVVHVGAKGITEEVIAEIDRALQAHELIKVRAASLDRDAREEALSLLLLGEMQEELQDARAAAMQVRLEV